MGAYLFYLSFYSFLPLPWSCHNAAIWENRCMSSPLRGYAKEKTLWLFVLLSFVTSVHEGSLSFTTYPKLKLTKSITLYSQFLKENWGIYSVIAVTLLSYVIVVYFVEYSIALKFPLVVNIGQCTFLLVASLFSIPSVCEQPEHGYKGYLVYTFTFFLLFLLVLGFFICFTNPSSLQTPSIYLSNLSDFFNATYWGSVGTFSPNWNSKSMLKFSSFSPTSLSCPPSYLFYLTYFSTFFPLSFFLLFPSLPSLLTFVIVLHSTNFLHINILDSL